MSGTERYHRYRGKRRGRGSFVLRIVVVVLAVVLALCLAAMVLLDGYIQPGGTPAEEGAAQAGLTLEEAPDSGRRTG